MNDQVAGAPVTAPASAEPKKTRAELREERQARRAKRGRAKARESVDCSIELIGVACVSLIEAGPSPDLWLRVQRLAKIAGVLSRELATSVAALKGRGGGGPLPGGIHAPYAVGVGEVFDPLDQQLGEEYPPMLQAAPNDNVQLMREMIPALQKMADKQGLFPPREATPYDLSSAMDVREKLVAAKASTEEIDTYIEAVKASFKRQAAELGKLRVDVEGKAAVAVGQVLGQQVLGPALVGR